MTPPEFRAALHRLGWTLIDAARILRKPYRTVHAWADAGPHHRDPDPTALLVLDLAEHVPAARRRLEGS